MPTANKINVRSGATEYLETLNISPVNGALILVPSPIKVPPIIHPAILSYWILNALESKKVSWPLPMLKVLP